MIKFNADNARLTHQFEEIEWLQDNAESETEIRRSFEALMQNEAGCSKAMIKAKTLELLASRGRIAVDREDIFQDKLCGGGLIAEQRARWEKEMIRQHLNDEFAQTERAWKVCGAYSAFGDYGHTSPNSKLLLEIGFSGLYSRLEKASSQGGLDARQKDFYQACMTAVNAIRIYLGRLADAVEKTNPDNAKALRNLQIAAPANFYEALQALIAYFFFHEYVGATRVRTLGRLDVLLLPFFQNDLERGLYAKDEMKEMLKFFLNKFWSAKVPYDLPLCLGGMDEAGNEVTNEISYLLVETYREMGIYSPKIHVRISEKTPVEFVKLILKCIRSGKSSFVFVNDEVAVKSLMGVGIEERDAWNYVPIGCYEPAVWGVEMGCTGNGGINLAKAVEYVMNDGIDFAGGTLEGEKTGNIESYRDFEEAVKKQISLMVKKALGMIIQMEKHYDQVNPDPILSAMYDESVERGRDVYEGGAKYNNSSLYFMFLATLADSMSAVKKFVFEEKRVTFGEMKRILKENWKGHEALRAEILRMPEKYGNNHQLVDGIAKEMGTFCASLVNGRPNGRGGVFKAGCFSIDFGFAVGEKTMATPDGRRCSEALSKNLCAVVGMDRKGITALIHSATRLDHSLFPDGSVLDVMLHPSAVRGEEGVAAFYALLKTYMKKGGFAMHGNVFDAEELKKAKENPEKYQNLQVRVCGWNAYFVRLSDAVQDAFIRQAENLG